MIHKSVPIHNFILVKNGKNDKTGSLYLSYVTFSMNSNEPVSPRVGVKAGQLVIVIKAIGASFVNSQHKSSKTLALVRNPP